MRAHALHARGARDRCLQHHLTVAVVNVAEELGSKHHAQTTRTARRVEQLGGGLPDDLRLAWGAQLEDRGGDGVHLLRDALRYAALRPVAGGGAGSDDVAEREQAIARHAGAGRARLLHDERHQHVRGLSGRGQLGVVHDEAADSSDDLEVHVPLARTGRVHSAYDGVELTDGVVEGLELKVG